MVHCEVVNDREGVLIKLKGRLHAFPRKQCYSIQNPNPDRIKAGFSIVQDTYTYEISMLQVIHEEDM